MRLFTLAVLLEAALLCSPLAAQPVPQDLNQFGLICFCNSRVATPHKVIAYDNNGRVLLRTRQGATREQLAQAGAAVSDSQVQMLKDWGLLREQDKVLTTAFPVLEPGSMAALRQRLEPIADRILPALQPHAAALKQELARRGQADAAYALLFSYVLDGLVWEELAASGRLPSPKINVARPYWAGTFWAVYPKQEAMPGTNARSTGRAALRVMWNPQVLQAVNGFHAATQTGAWLEALEAGRATPDLFLGSTARPVVVREEAGDPLFVHGLAMARPIAAALLATDLSRQLPAADESQRLLIGTHELIWILLSRLAAEQKIAVPHALSTGARSGGDLAPLVIGVLSRRDKPSTL